MPLQLGKVSWAHCCTLSAEHYQCYQNKTGQKLRVQIVCRDITSPCTTVTDKKAEPAIAVSGGRMKKRNYWTGTTRIRDAEAKMKDEAYVKSLLLKSAHAKSIEASLMSRKLLKKNEDFTATTSLVKEQREIIEATELTIFATCKKLKQSQSLTEYYKAKAAPVCRSKEDCNDVYSTEIMKTFFKKWENESNVDHIRSFNRDHFIL
jgi:hypothetical protein